QEMQMVAGGNFVPYLGAAGWVGGVPRSNPHPDAAFALLAFLSSPRISRDVVIEPSWGGGAFRRDHLKNIRLGGIWARSQENRNHGRSLARDRCPASAKEPCCALANTG